MIILYAFYLRSFPSIFNCKICQYTQSYFCYILRNQRNVHILYGILDNVIIPYNEALTNGLDTGRNDNSLES